MKSIFPRSQGNEAFIGVKSLRPTALEDRGCHAHISMSRKYIFHIELFLFESNIFGLTGSRGKLFQPLWSARCPWRRGAAFHLFRQV